MSAMTADAADFPEHRRERGSIFKEAGRGIKRAVVATGRAAWRGVKALGRGTVRVVATVGFIATSVVWIAALILTLALLLVAVVVVALAVIITYPLGMGADWWNTNVVAIPAYFLKKRPEGFRQYREDREVNLIGKGVTRIDSFIKTVRMGSQNVAEATAQQAPATATPPSEGGRKWGERFMDSVRLSPGLVARAKAVSDNDLLNRDAAFPGVETVDLPTGLDGDPVVIARSNIGVLDALGDAVVDKTTIDFTPYVGDKELEDAFHNLALASKSKEEKAYWLGRYEMLKIFRKYGSEYVTSHGKAWALIHNRYLHEQASVPLAYLRAGQQDMVTEINTATVSPRPRGPRSSRSNG